MSDQPSPHAAPSTASTPVTLRAALFDMDGLLLDSYAAHLRSWSGMARENGLPFSEADFVRGFGRTSREVITTNWPDHAADVERLDGRKEELFRAQLADVPLMDGAVELLDALAAAGWRLAIASSAPPANVEPVLDRLGRQRFGTVVTGRDVERGKPDPQVFQLAAERLGVPAAGCVVVEDAAVGVVAAHRAGMRAVALLSTGHREEEHAGDPPDLVVRSLRELSPARLDELLTAAQAVNGRGRG